MSEKPLRILPISIRLDEDLEARLKKCVQAIKVNKHSFARDAVEAAVIAVEQNGYKVVLPIEFDVKNVPVPKPKKTS